jgi:hypothetical protein
MLAVFPELEAFNISVKVGDSSVPAAGFIIEQPGYILRLTVSPKDSSVALPLLSFFPDSLVSHLFPADALASFVKQPIDVAVSVPALHAEAHACKYLLGARFVPGAAMAEHIEQTNSLLSPLGAAVRSMGRQQWYNFLESNMAGIALKKVDNAAYLALEGVIKALHSVGEREALLRHELRQVPDAGTEDLDSALALLAERAQGGQGGIRRAPTDSTFNPAALAAALRLRRAYSIVLGLVEEADYIPLENDGYGTRNRVIGKEQQRQSAMDVRYLLSLASSLLSADEKARYPTLSDARIFIENPPPAPTQSVIDDIFSRCAALVSDTLLFNFYGAKVKERRLTPLHLRALVERSGALAKVILANVALLRRLAEHHSAFDGVTPFPADFKAGTDPAPYLPEAFGGFAGSVPHHGLLEARAAAKRARELLERREAALPRVCDNLKFLISGDEQVLSFLERPERIVITGIEGDWQERLLVLFERVRAGEAGVTCELPFLEMRPLARSIVYDSYQRHVHERLRALRALEALKALKESRFYASFMLQSCSSASAALKYFLTRLLDGRLSAAHWPGTRRGGLRGACALQCPACIGADVLAEGGSGGMAGEMEDFQAEEQVEGAGAEEGETEGADEAEGEDCEVDDDAADMD